MSQACGDVLRADVRGTVSVTRRRRAARARTPVADREAAMDDARFEAIARGYLVESVTWSEELQAPVVQVWAGVQSVSREEPS